MGDLQGKVALVTGATSGIGLETAKALAARGAHVVIGVRNPSAGQEVVTAIKDKLPSAKVELGPPLDLISQESVKSFATEFNKKYPQLHILVNNAGVSFMKRYMTPEGIGGIAQTNHLGPYTLTRLLEKKLVESKARVVTVASVKHRTVTIGDAEQFLKDFRKGYYEQSKLANVLFGYELQRRLGNRGVQSCVADPGGVRSSIWDSSPLFKKGLYRTIIDACYSPPEDGCQGVVYAATVPWEKDRKVVNGTPLPPAQDLRYYCRGLFCNSLMCNLDGITGKGWGFSQNVKGYIWGITSLWNSLWDWPLRKWTGGKLASKIKPCRSSTQSYDETLAAELWDVSADAAGLPRQPQV